jgi:low temperature requirement protein LtrA
MSAIDASLFIVWNRRWRMTYKRYDILTVSVWVVLGAALIVLGLFLRRPDLGERVWWVVMGVGIALAVVGIVSIGFSMRQTVEMQCPHCGGKVVPRVKSSTSHLYLTKGEEKAVGSAEGEEKGPED